MSNRARRIGMFQPGSRTLVHGEQQVTCEGQGTTLTERIDSLTRSRKVLTIFVAIPDVDLRALIGSTRPDVLARLTLVVTSTNATDSSDELPAQASEKIIPGHDVPSLGGAEFGFRCAR